MPSRIIVSRTRIELVEVGSAFPGSRRCTGRHGPPRLHSPLTRRCAQAFAHSPHGLAVELLCRDAVVSWKLAQTSCLGNNKDAAVPAGGEKIRAPQPGHPIQSADAS